MFFKLTDRLGA